VREFAAGWGAGKDAADYVKVAENAKAFQGRSFAAALGAAICLTSSEILLIFSRLQAA